MNRLKYFRFLSSLKITIAALFGIMVLVFLGTLEQVSTGIYVAQEKYFRSFFVYFFGFPVFPGGYLLGSILLVNLTFSYLFRFRLTRQKMGLFILHIGISLLILGELLNGFFSIESQIAIKVGETKNYSESPRVMELVITDTSNPNYDQVLSIPQGMLKAGKVFQLPSLPFRLTVKSQYPNARLQWIKGEYPPLLANQGVGKQIWVNPLPPFKKDNQINHMTVFVELKTNDEQSLGTWLFSNAITTPQVVQYHGKEYEIAIRRRRYYYPFTLMLTQFTHEKHPGTDIPKNFSSTVELYSEKGTLDRKVFIYMNHPLRYQGKTFYQASYGENDTLSVFHVVDNPTRQLPYISSALVAVGLLIQIVNSFTQSKRRS